MRSMTAYASVYKREKSQDVQIVLRSLNFKYLDILIHNLPMESVLLEEAIKREVKKRILRGKIGVFIFLKQPQEKKVFIDERVVARYVLQTRKLAKKYKLRADISISEILSLPQTISWHQKNGRQDSVVIPALRQALDKLIEFKEKEGSAIKKEILTNLNKLKNNVRKIKKDKPKIGDMTNGKEDIDEELSLASFYISKIEENISSKKETGKGKSMDFLTQEILRELNAASSKTKKKIPALLIVESKNYLERIREQAQNIE